MTRAQAHAEACRRWSTPGFNPGDRCGVVVLRRKNVTDRCEVGYMVRIGRSADGVYHSEPMVVLGRGPTWEQAFAAADQAAGK